ncbi:MAG: hypothetical protein C0391_05560 [Anaerolinea sp.]|nr:hypothetical protein [Anaerolinea sp.]
MSALRELFKKAIPEALKPSVRAGYDALRRVPELPAAFFHPWRMASIRQLREYKDIHWGRRCFIIGNGPSLKQLDLTLLKDEYTFGMNRIYMAFPEMGFATSYYVCMNDLVVEQCASDIQQLTMPRFISWRGRQWVNREDDLNFIYSTYTSPRFAKDITGRVWESATVTFVALQLAYYMGFDTVYLIGVDHNFVTQGPPNTTVISQGDDPNHFNPGYFGKGFRWQLPDLETSEIGYRLAKEAFSKDGRQVLDATLGGKLTIFPKANYAELFKKNG